MSKSRFWGGDSDTEDDDDITTEEEEEEDEGPTNFFGSSDTDSDEKRVVKSAKEKKWEEMRATSIDLKNKINAQDWVGIVKAFDVLNKQVDKASAVIAKAGLPKFYVRTLVRLEDALKAVEDKGEQKKLSKTNGKSFNTMKQRLRKHNVNYQSDIDAFRKDPVDTDDEEEEEEEEDDWDPNDSHSDDGKAKQAPKQAPKAAAAPVQTEWTRPAIKLKLADVLASRGKKGTDNNSAMDELRKLVDLAPDVQTQLEVLVMLIAAQFDTRNAGTHMHIVQWKRAYQNIFKVVDLIEKNSDLTVVELNDQIVGDAEGDDNQLRIQGSLLAFCERLDDEFAKSLQFIDPHTKEYVQRLKDENLFLLLAVRMENYYRKRGNTFAVHRIALRRIERLYYRREELNPLKMLVVGHKAAENKRKGWDKKKVSANEEALILGEQGASELQMSIHEVIQSLATIIYKGEDERAKTRTVLCQVFNLALSDRYYEARDLFLMSHLQDSIQQTDIATQILFNRTMVQIGLCAFRQGLMAEAHSCLSDLHATGKIKELLAQGITSRFAEKNVEQEKLAKMRQIPYHMHINLELIDACHYISAMLLEIPNMAFNPLDTKRKNMISRPFRRLLEGHDRQLFNGPPENTHSFILAASVALGEGSVDKCCDLLLNLKVWELVPSSQKMKEMLQSRIRIEGLRTHLFKHSHMYSSIGAQQLADTFHLSLSEVNSIVSKMMMNEELHASWDQPTNCIVMHRVEPTRLQGIALQFADKMNSLVENNEKMLESITGVHGFDQGGKSGGRDQRGDWQSRKGNRGGKPQRFAGHRNPDKRSSQYD